VSYLLHLAIYLSIYGIVAMSLNLVIGYCGLLTLAHASYFAIGSYVYGLITLKLGWDFFPAMGAGMVTAAVLSLAVSLPALRFRGDFFVMVSLMACMVLVGGVGNFRGPLVGAFLLVLIPELLRFAMIPDAIAANLRLILYGVLLVVMMHLRPQGIAGDYRVD